MNDIYIAFLLFLLTFITIYYYYYKKMVIRLNKQKIDILRYQIYKYNFMEDRIDRLTRSKKLWAFIESIESTIDSDVDQFLSFLRREKVNIDELGTSKSHFNSTFSSEILKLIKSNQTKNVEKEFINKFIELQLMILSIKHPIKYRYVLLRLKWSKQVVGNLLMLAFRVYVELKIFFGSSSKTFNWNLGPYALKAELKKDKVVKKIVNQEEKVNILQSLRSVNLIGC